MKKPGYKKIPIGGNIIKPGNSIEYKTGDWRIQRPIRDPKKCTNCLLCFQFCPENCIKVKKGQIKDSDLNYCKGCGLCETQCPVKAIIMKREEECKI